MLLGLALFLAVLATFWPSVNNDFINYDDPDYITLNTHVQQGLTWPGVKWAFGSTGEAANWHPITWLSHMLDCELFRASPRGHHGTSVLLHSVNALLLFLLLYRLTGKKWRSLAVAALFGLHPLRVESVAWIAERKDVLSALFFMLTLLAYVRYVERSGAEGRGRTCVVRGPWSVVLPFYLLSLLFFALGLMSKPMLVTLPFVLLLLDYWPLRRFGQQNFRGLLAEKAPFLLLPCASVLITLFVQRSSGAIHTNRPLAIHLQTAIISYARYLVKLFWPAGLAVHYPYPDHWPVVVVLLSTALVAGLSLAVLLAHQRCPCLLTGWFWYLGMLVPVIGLIQVGTQSMADRYTYLPCIGVLIMVVWTASELTKAWRRRSVLLGFALCITSLACIAATRRQIGFWQDSGTLFQHALDVTENDDIAFMRLGDHFRQQRRITEAMDMYRRAIRIDPLMEEPEVNLGVLLYLNGRQDEGIQHLEQAARLLPNSAMVHSNLGLFLVSRGRLDEAATHLETALKLKPDYPEAHVAMGDVCMKKGQRGAAIEHYRQALKLRPGFAPAEHRLQSMGPG